MAKQNEPIEMEDESESAEQVPTCSALSTEIQNFHSTILRVAGERERLPQPLFWSLFHSRISELRKQKEIDRLLDKAFNGVE